MPTLRFAWLALVVALPAGGLAAWRGFDGLYGQDAYAYFDYATTSVRHSMLNLAPLQAFFWPPGYPLLVAATSLITGPTPLAGQLVSLATGALVPLLTALLAYELWPEQPRVAVLAGLSAALSGQLWQSSIVVMADTTGLALATASAFCLVKYAKSGSLAWLVLASAALACAMLARWIYGLVALPFGVYAALSLARAKPKRALVHACVALVTGAALLLPILAPGLLGLLTDPQRPAAFAGNLQVYSWSPLNAFRRDFMTADGHLAYNVPNGVYYAIAPANLAFFGPLIALWLLVGAWAAWRTWPRATLTLLIGWAAIVYAFHAGAPWQNFRFTLAYLPPLAIMAATGVVWAVDHLRDRRLTAAVSACVALGLVASAGAGLRLVDGFVDRKDADLSLARWVQAQVPSTGELLTFGITLTVRHYTNVPTLDLFDITPTDVASLVATARPTYVLVDPASIEGQWLGQAPATNFLELRNWPGLEPLGAQGSYTLYRLKRQ
jgi:4-amino-4-deoxy-L-arabinose transferase-like glycosyltransferase